MAKKMGKKKCGIKKKTLKILEKKINLKNKNIDKIVIVSVKTGIILAEAKRKRKKK